ncbi:MAG: rod shape-determining protein MreD [Oscillospiraceae bacterium]
MRIKNEKLLPVIKWAIYYLLLLFFYTLQTTPELFQIFGVKPVLILPLVVCISMYEGVMPSAIVAMIAGLLWDISSDKLFGFNAIILLSCSVLISLVCIYYLRTKLVNSIGFCCITALLQGLLDFVFYYAIWNYSNVSVILLHDILPTIVYTVLLTPIFYYLIRLIGVKFNQTSRA